GRQELAHRGHQVSRHYGGQHGRDGCSDRRRVGEIDGVVRFCGGRGGRGRTQSFLKNKFGPKSSVSLNSAAAIKPTVSSRASSTSIRAMPRLSWSVRVMPASTSRS